MHQKIHTHFIFFTFKYIFLSFIFVFPNFEIKWETVKSIAVVNLSTNHKMLLYIKRECEPFISYYILLVKNNTLVLFIPISFVRWNVTTS